MMKKLLLLVLLFVPSTALAQTIDCDAPAPTTPGQITTGRPYTIAFCLPPTTVTNPDGTTSDVPSRVDGYTASLNGGAPVELGKLVAGTPAPTTKMQPVSYRTTTGVPKGNHTVVVTAWNCPIDVTTGLPMPTCTVAQRQNASPVSIPFVATDEALGGPPPAIQKGRIIR